MRTWNALAAVVFCVALGCESGSPPPDVFAAKGVVLGADGAPAKSGMVEFRQMDAPYLVASGRIGQDGSFELASIHEEQRLAGAPAGAYRVTVHPDFSKAAEAQHLAVPVTLPEPLSISASGPNEFEIDVRKGK